MNNFNTPVLSSFFRSYSSGIVGSIAAVSKFSSTKLFPVFLDKIGFSGTFIVYAGIMLALIIYGTFSIPENKGESLAKTEDKMVSVQEGQKNITFQEDTAF